MPKFCVFVGEERRYYCNVMIDAESAGDAMEKVEAAIEHDLGDFPTSRRYASDDKSIVCVDGWLDCTAHIEAIEAEELSGETVEDIMAQIEAEGGLIV